MISMVLAPLLGAMALPSRACCTPADSLRLDSVLTTEMHHRRAPGASMVVTQNDRVVLSLARESAASRPASR